MHGWLNVKDQHKSLLGFFFSWKLQGLTCYSPFFIACLSANYDEIPTSDFKTFMHTFSYLRCIQVEYSMREEKCCAFKTTFTLYSKEWRTRVHSKGIQKLARYSKGLRTQRRLRRIAIRLIEMRVITDFEGFDGSRRRQTGPSCCLGSRRRRRPGYCGCGFLRRWWSHSSVLWGLFRLASSLGTLMVPTDTRIRKILRLPCVGPVNWTKHPKDNT